MIPHANSDMDRKWVEDESAASCNMLFNGSNRVYLQTEKVISRCSLDFPKRRQVGVFIDIFLKVNMDNICFLRCRLLYVHICILTYAKSVELHFKQDTAWEETRI